MPKVKKGYFKQGYLASGNRPQVQPSINDLAIGLKTLQGFWKRGLFPWDLRKHFLLTWYALANGNILRMARMLGRHRNHLIVLFGKEKIGEKSYGLRKLWQDTRAKKPREPFDKSLLRYFRRVGPKPKFTPMENRKLVNLWLLGFPEEVLLSHYIFCSFQDGITRKQVGKRLGVSVRSVHRICYASAKKGSLAAVWLSPLKPTKAGWYPGWAPHSK